MNKFLNKLLEELLLKPVAKTQVGMEKFAGNVNSKLLGNDKYSRLNVTDYSKLLGADTQKAIEANPVKQGIAKGFATAADYGMSFALPTALFRGGAFAKVASPTARLALKAGGLLGARSAGGALSAYGASDKGKEVSSALTGGVLGALFGGAEGALSKAFRPNYVNTFKKGLGLNTTGLKKPKDIEQGLTELYDTFKKSVNKGIFTDVDALDNRYAIQAQLSKEVDEVGSQVVVPKFKQFIEDTVAKFTMAKNKGGELASIVANNPAWDKLNKFIAEMGDDPTVSEVHTVTDLINEVVGGYQGLGGNSKLAQAMSNARNAVFDGLEEVTKGLNEIPGVGAALDAMKKSQRVTGILNGFEAQFNKTVVPQTGGAGPIGFALSQGLKSAKPEAQIAATKGMKEALDPNILNLLGRNTTQQMPNVLGSLLGGSQSSQVTPEATGTDGGSAQSLAELLSLQGLKTPDQISSMINRPSGGSTAKSSGSKAFLKSLKTAASLFPNGSESEILTLAKQLYDLDNPTTKIDATTKAKMAEAEAGLGLLDVLQNKYEEVQNSGLTASGSGAGLLGGLSGSIASLLQTSPEAAAYQNATSAFMSKLAKAAGEKGVLTDADLERIKKAIPSFYTAPETAKQQWELVRSIVSSAITSTGQGGESNQDPLMQLLGF